MSAYDHIAQRLFLDATTRVLAPSPIQKLERLVFPAFEQWGAAFNRQLARDRKPFIEGKVNSFTFLVPRTLEELDDSGIGSDLSRAISGWMKACRFDDGDHWIATAAIHSMLAGAPKPPTVWFVPFEPWPRHKGISPQPWESERDFTSRAKSEIAELVKEHRMRGKHKSASQEHATWCALKFSGLTYTAIADSLSSRRALTDDAIRKAVERFAELAGLTMPTFGETSGSPSGNIGKSKGKAGKAITA